MTSNQSIGPVMLDIAGFELTSEDRDILMHPHVGGVILFSRNYDSPSQLNALTQSIRRVRSPILIAVDQEGGRVQRFRKGFTRLVALGDIGQAYDKNPEKAITHAYQHAVTMGKELLRVGIDFSFAPVLDLNKGLNAVIGDRSFGADADTVIALGKAYLKGLKKAGVPSVGKHFPGHGNTCTDSHHAVATDIQTYAALCRADRQPFEVLLPLLTAIMPAHVIYPCKDKHYPAGFSSAWLQVVLRDELGFQGAILSDDISMQGAVASGSVRARYLLALNAGCDMVLVCNDRKAAIEVLDSPCLSVWNERAHQRLMTLSRQ